MAVLLGIVLPSFGRMGTQVDAKALRLFFQHPVGWGDVPGIPGIEMHDDVAATGKGEPGGIDDRGQVYKLRWQARIDLCHAVVGEKDIVGFQLQRIGHVFQLGDEMVDLLGGQFNRWGDGPVVVGHVVGLPDIKGDQVGTGLRGKGQPLADDLKPALQVQRFAEMVIVAGTDTFDGRL